MPSDIRSRIFLYATVTSAILGVIAFVLKMNWENPDRHPVQKTLTYPFGSKDFSTTVVCDCPDYLIRGQLTNIPITISNTTASIAPAPLRSIATPSPTQSHTTSGATPNTATSANMPAANATVSTDLSTAKLWLEFQSGGQWAKFSDGYWNQPIGDANSTIPIQYAKFPATATDGTAHFGFLIGIARPDNTWISESATAPVVFDLESKPAWIGTTYTSVLWAAIACFLTSGVMLIVTQQRTTLQTQETRLADAKDLVEKNPDGARYAWQLAHTRLENYFDRNLFQVNLVFWTAIIVMVAGFLVVLWGVSASLSPEPTTAVASAALSTTSTSTSAPDPNPNNKPARVVETKEIQPGAKIATGAGILTQFLGATIMVLYRSTMKQANDFMVVLDRINNVGMAMQVLDQIPEDPPALKNDVRARIIERLLSLGHADAPPIAGAAAKPDAPAG